MQSTSWTGSKVTLARAGTTAYREAAVASAASACSSPRPDRHQPGQSTAHANTRLVPISRYTPVTGTIFAGVAGPALPVLELQDAPGQHLNGDAPRHGRACS